MKKILFIHNTLNDYRIPLFRLLNQEYDITFLITREDTKKAKKISDLKLEILNHKMLFNKYGLAWSIPFKLLFKKSDIIIANDPHVFETYLAFFIAKLKRKKFVLWSETFDWPRAPRSKIVNPLIRFIIKRTDSCIALGTKAKEYFKKMGAKEENIFLAPDTALTLKEKDTAKIKKDLESKFDIQGRKIILYLSRIVPYKGLDYLIKAFAKLEKEEKVSLLIAGDGPFKKKIIKLIDTLKIKNAHFLGWINREQTGSLYSLSDVFVLPSVFRDYDAECWGLVLNEAMALGTPVISTDKVGAAYDLIKNGENGYMVKGGDINELYEALKKIVSNDELRKKMGKRSKEIIDQEFNYDKMYKGFKKAIEK